MAKKDPFTFQRRRQHFQSIADALAAMDRKPFLGVTQGGSSRKDSGARVAATNGLRKEPRRRRNDG